MTLTNQPILQSKNVPWIYDSRTMKNIVERRNFINEQLESIYKGYHSFVGVRSKILIGPSQSKSLVHIRRLLLLYIE